MVLFWLLLFKRGGGTTDQLQKSSFSAIVHLSLQEWGKLFSSSFPMHNCNSFDDSIGCFISSSVSNNNNEQVQFSSFQKGGGA